MIWKKINPRFLPFYQLMLETGLRAGDMWNLTKDNFIDGKTRYGATYSDG